MRVSARVLLLDPDGRVLLFRGFDPRRPGSFWWFTVGGAVEPGEDLRAAAVRETAEETGIVLATDALRGPVWRRLATFTFDGRLFEAEEWFFVATAVGPVDTAGFTELEARTVVEHRWWSAAELAATDDTVHPRRLAELLTVAADGWDGHTTLLDDR